MGSITSSAVGAPLGLVNLNPATVPLVVKGAASQSADLQQWQDSTATTMLSVSIGAYSQGQIANPYGNGIVLKDGSATVRLSGNQSAWTDSTLCITYNIDYPTTHAAVLGGGAAGNPAPMSRLLVNSERTQFRASTQGSAPIPTATAEVLNTSDLLGFKIVGNSSQTADLQQWQDSAAHVQFGVANAGTGAAPQWALRARAVANAESAAQTHTLGAYSGRSIQLLDDAGSTIGWLPIYA